MYVCYVSMLCTCVCTYARVYVCTLYMYQMNWYNKVFGLWRILTTKLQDFRQTLQHVFSRIFRKFLSKYFVVYGTLIFVSLHSYNSLRNRGSVLVLVIRLIHFYWKLFSNLQILLDMIKKNTYTHSYTEIQIEPPKQKNPVYSSP